MKRVFLIVVCALVIAGCVENNTSDVKVVKNNDSKHIELVWRYLANDSLDDAMHIINQMLSDDGKDVDALLALADVYYKQNDYDNILATLNKACEVAPYDSRPLIKLAELSMIQGNLNLTNAFIDKAIELDVVNPKAYYMRGLVNMAKNDTAQAMKQFMIAQEQDASFIDPLIQIASIYAAQRDSLAVDYYDLAIKMQSDDPSLYYAKAMYLQDNGDPETAIKIYDTINVMKPRDYYVLFNQGYVYLVYLLNYDKAIEYFDKALEIDPKSVDALLNKGIAYEEKGNYRKAKSIYLQILKDNPNYQLAIDALHRIGE